LRFSFFFAAAGSLYFVSLHNFFCLRQAIRCRGLSFVWQQKKQKCRAAFLLA
jgi:hypothetical protein